MHRRVSPPLIKEAPRAVQVVKVVFVLSRAPEVHIGDFKVAPEVAGGVAVRFGGVAGTVGGVGEPFEGVVGVDVVWVLGEEFEGLGPEGLDGFGGVVDVDYEAVGFVVVFHVLEDVVVDVAEEAAGVSEVVGGFFRGGDVLDFGLDTPVPADVLEGGVLVELARVPTTHLVVALELRVLDLLLD